MFATIVTLIALPTLWLVSRDEARDGTGAPSVAALGAGNAVGSAGSSAHAGNATDVAATAPPNVPRASVNPVVDELGDAFGDTHPVFLDGPTAPPVPVVLDVAVPTTDPNTSMSGLASYVRSDVPDRCDTPHAPVNATVVVTNVNNGRSVTCRNTFTFGLTNGLIVILDQAAFLKIGDLIAAPVPVRITW